ncbi:MAG: cytochrome c [Terracidiphilus sp.]|jgi:mono/diheme cytochrome c family protein
MILGSRAATVVLMVAFMAGPALAQTRGVDIYKAKCAMCHGADGLANTPVGKSEKILSFKAPEMMKATDAQFIAFTKDAYGNKLTGAQITEVVKFIRTLQK